MVGVAGKSKACKDCKLRRVKCDFGQPGCKRCAIAQIQCAGYDQPTIFVNRTLAEPSISAPMVLSKAKNQSSEVQNELDYLKELLSERTTSPIYFRMTALQMLRKLYLPRSHKSEQDPSLGAPLSWVLAVCELTEPCFLLDHALLAFCTSQVYATKTGKVSLEEGAAQYHAGLQLLCSVSTWEGDTRLDYILASVVVLSTCELFVSSTDEGWQIHVQGIANILSLRKGTSRMPPNIWNCLCSRLRLISVSEVNRFKPYR